MGRARDEGQQIGFEHLDLWFIEVCRRIRLKNQNGHLCGQSGNSEHSPDVG